MQRVCPSRCSEVLATSREAADIIWSCLAVRLHVDRHDPGASTPRAAWSAGAHAASPPRRGPRTRRAPCPAVAATVAPVRSWRPTSAPGPTTMPTPGTAKWPKPKSEDEFEDIVLDAL